MFADIDPNTLLWGGGTGGVIGICYALLKLYDHFRKKRVEWETAEHEQRETEKHSVTEEQILTRRTAAIEAVPVVERLTLEIEAQDRKIKELEKSVQEIEERERECSEARREDRVLLVILATWARTQKNAPPIPEEMLKRFIVDNRSPPLPGSVTC